MKTITIPQFYLVNGESFQFDIRQEVPCDIEDPVEATQIPPQTLNGFSYDVDFFQFISDTGNGTSRLRFQIILNNPEDSNAQGVPILTLEIDGVETIVNYSREASEPCLQIAANSICRFTYDQENSLDVAQIDNIELINLEYYLTNSFE